MIPDASRQWRVRSDTRLAWCDWRDESLIFDELSGDTHLLDMVSAAGLRLLYKEWHTVESLAISLAKALDEPLDETIHHYADRLIILLSEKGILETIADNSQ